MEKIYENIINEGKKDGKTIEAVNAELKAAGANFHLTPDGCIAGWSDKEMAEGFIPAKANTEEEVWTPEGHYRITFDENGHATKAVRI